MAEQVICKLCGDVVGELTRFQIGFNAKWIGMPICQGCSLELVDAVCGQMEIIRGIKDECKEMSDLRLLSAAGSTDDDLGQA